MSPTLSAAELKIDDSTVAIIRQRDTRVNHQPRMLCVHGWLDNANSFAPMLPYLPAFDLVAIDLPGNGYSDAQPGGYHIHELGFLLHRIMQALKWPECHLTGHSLGGGLIPLLAVASPTSVQSLTMIEASGPLTEPVSNLPKRMAKAFNDRSNVERFNSRLFANKQEAIDSRLKAAKMEPAAAKLIIDRQVEQTAEGYRWRFDKRWRFASSMYHTEEQVQAILKAIQCPVLTILADNGFLASRDDTNARLACIETHETITLPGHHHLHMDTPEPVAAAINRFLGTTPALGG